VRRREGLEGREWEKGRRERAEKRRVRE